MAFEIRHASCHVCGASMAAGLLKKHVAAGGCNARVLAIQLAGEGLRRAGMAWRRFLRLGFVLPVHPTGKGGNPEQWAPGWLVRLAEAGASDEQIQTAKRERLVAR